ncbi:MAG TPA: DUF805 domain-containing protein [Gemmobacter sp.]|nr:DUF805 domain-containing protein [Gemmobacter sp.]
MQFQESIRHVLITRYMAIFQGRASRSEFWWFQLFQLLLAIVVIIFFGVIAGLAGLSLNNPDVLAGTLAGAGMTLGVIVLFILYIVLATLYLYFLAPASLAVLVRRLHDRNMSGWWLLVPFAIMLIPLVGLLIAVIGMIVVLCLKGTDGPNRFGPDPLQPQSSSDIFG